MGRLVGRGHREQGRGIAIKAMISTFRPAAIALSAAWLVGTSAFQASPGQEAGDGLKDAARAFARRQVEGWFRSMNRPFPPFRIIDNIYYVGASDTASYLIATPEGHILINSGFEATVPMIRDSVRKLGFRFEDIKVLLAGHAHIDHAGGHASIKKQTGACVVMSEADAALLARGGRGDFLPASDEVVGYEPAQADRIIRDGDTVTLGGVTLTAHLTPGHTKGCTTWTMKVKDDGKRRDVVFHGGTTILPGVRLVDNPDYPGMAEDYERTFRVLKGLPGDVFLATHGFQFGLTEKARRLSAGASPNPFIDPEGYRTFVARGEEAFRLRLQRERRRPGEQREEKRNHE
jgi:metallo-beta-lactamase class B